MSLLSLEYFSLCVDAVQQIFREEGFRGLWSGTRASLVLATNPAIQFTVYETVKRYMRGANKEVRYGYWNEINVEIRKLQACS